MNLCLSLDIVLKLNLTASTRYAAGLGTLDSSLLEIDKEIFPEIRLENTKGKPMLQSGHCTKAKSHKSNPECRWLIDTVLRYLGS